MSAPLRIAMWSGPRNISTAMLRAWENRLDTAVVDEPLYAHYLASTGIDHPGREAVLASQSSSAAAVIAQLTGAVPDGKPIWYQKLMVHHMLADVPRDWLAGFRHAFLIRAPAAVVASYRRRREQASAADLGFEQEWRLFEQVRERTGLTPPVFDAADILRDPPAMLRLMCDALGVAFSERMLHWPVGSRPSDGAWAPHWYDAVQRSTGFTSASPGEPELNDAQTRLVEQCRPWYERMHDVRVRPGFSLRDATGEMSQWQDG